jgi:hypothetical protein
MNNKIKKMEVALNFLVILFWIAIGEIAAGLIILLFYNDSVQKVSNAFAILCLGILASLLCYRMCNNIKNELQSEIFTT